MKDWYTEKRIPASIPKSGMEYEYLYVNGELDIDCIILKKKREHIGTYKIQDVVSLAPLDQKRLRGYRRDRNIKDPGLLRRAEKSPLWDDDFPK